MEGCSDIERLVLYACEEVDDELLAKIAECCKTLKYLRTDSKNISDTDMVELVDSCPLLWDLNVRSCVSQCVGCDESSDRTGVCI